MADKIQRHKEKFGRKNISRDCYDMFRNLTIMSKIGHDVNIALC